MVWLKAMDVAQKAMGSLVDPNMGRVLVKMHGGLESGMVNVKGVAWGFGMARFLELARLKEVSQGMIGYPKRWYAAVKMGQGARSWRDGFVGGSMVGRVDDVWKAWCRLKGLLLGDVRHMEWV